MASNHCYTSISRTALKKFKDTELSNLNSLDIGSGGGGTVTFKTSLGHKISAGSGFDGFLHKRAMKNFRILNMTSLCNSLNIDARYFKIYGHFNIFYLLNLFCDKAYVGVLANIATQIKHSDEKTERCLICYGENNIASVITLRIFKIIREDQGPHRGSMHRVFKSIKKVDKNEIVVYN